MVYWDWFFKIVENTASVSVLHNATLVKVGLVQATQEIWRYRHTDLNSICGVKKNILFLTGRKESHEGDLNVPYHQAHGFLESGSIGLHKFVDLSPNCYWILFVFVFKINNNFRDGLLTTLLVKYILEHDACEQFPV